MIPTCRYGHGDLKLAEGLDGKPGNYLAPLIDKGFVNSTFGYTFQIWECAECSYVELHDGEKG